MNPVPLHTIETALRRITHLRIVTADRHGP